MKEIELNKGNLSVRESGQLRSLCVATESENAVGPRSGDAAEHCYQRALKLLAIRPRSRRELQTFLQKARFEPAPIEAALERLVQAHLVDDAVFAAYWRDNRTEFRPRSRRALNVELRQKGVSAEVSAEALTPLDDDALAYLAASHKAAKWSILDTEALKNKLHDFLKRRGFGWEASSSAIRRVLEERNSP